MRAIAPWMCIEACEEATIAANGYRFRVPYGKLHSRKLHSFIEPAFR